MEDTKYELIINDGNTFYHNFLDKKDFLRETSKLIKEPKKIFLGMGNFLELGDYNNLLDAILFEEDGIKLEKILDKNNRKMSEGGGIPFLFFKLGVYFPDLLLKDVPTSCVSTIGKKSRLVPGAEVFVKYIKEYDPLILSAIPYGLAIEFARRLNLGKENLIATDYKVRKDKNNKNIYVGGINQFISGDHKSLVIEKYMYEHDLTDDDIIYIGSGEAGIKTFSTIKHSIAFNPPENIMPKTEINLYGSSLESLLVLFNFDGILEKFLSSQQMEEYLPSLVVYSKVKEKNKDLIDIELEHRRLQNNILSQRVEHSGNSFDSVVNEINVDLKGSSIDIGKVRRMINERIKKHLENPQEIVKIVYNMAKERYKSLGMDQECEQ